MSAVDDAITRLSTVIGTAVTQLREVKANAEAVVANDATEDAAQAATLDLEAANKIGAVADALEAALAAPATETGSEAGTGTETGETGTGGESTL
ncbi:hypothetical protein [Rhodococcus sp. IEGM 1330]|uniref:hypothetical protein n=1 Tax=Rhodococcus sp. IEGM 1330 TaxID=3082225 RepID=UPI002953919B|nr:hypothetical protein [Rhodococcus sp. IEGM 1330]MDV8022263.1 hypothetical protein [Rhodococcus sp. IEGM 1330]